MLALQLSCVWRDENYGIATSWFVKVIMCEDECVFLAGILSSPLLAGLLPVCKLLAMYRESNEMKEAGWTTTLLSLQGIYPAIGLHSPGQLGCAWLWATGKGKSGFKTLLFLSNEAGNWWPSPQLSSSHMSLSSVCYM